MTHLKVESAATVWNEQGKDFAEVLADLQSSLKLMTDSFKGLKIKKKHLEQTEKEFNQKRIHTYLF